jgi:parallel beta-helix repeat protein
LLDSANYNSTTVNVTKSVTILAVPGALGSVVATGGPAINVATAGVKLALRNLVIVPLPGGGGTGGIVMTNGAKLTVENCLIANMPGDGINVDGSIVVRVTDTTIRDNGGAGMWVKNGASTTVTRATISGNGYFGVYAYGISGSPTTTTTHIADSTLDGNYRGFGSTSVNSSAVTIASVKDSRIVRNSDYGVIVESDAGAATSLSASNNIVANNGTNGFWAYGTGTKVWASGNTVSDNSVGFLNQANGSVFESAGNNAVRNNGTDTSGTITVISTK